MYNYIPDLQGGESAILPGVTSLVDQGYNCTFSTLMLVLGPKDMDQAKVTKIHDYFASAALNEEVKAILEPTGMAMEF